MKQLFFRFGLPWLIFGSAIFALCWNVLYGESAISSAKVAPRIFDVQPRNPPPTIKVGTEKSNIASPRNTEVPRAPTPLIPIEVSAQAPTQVSAPQTAMSVSPNSESNILLALKNSDSNIRYRALADSDAQGIVLPAHELQQLASSDRDPLVRILAMNKFSQDPDVEPALVKSVAEAALRDADSAISAHAREMLEQLNQASRANEEIAQMMPEDTPVE
jgi:hypothetical protein